MTQLAVYTDEKYEDEEDMRERARNLMTQGGVRPERAHSDSEVALEDLVRLAKQHGELYPMMMEIMNHYGQILQRDVGMWVLVAFSLPGTHRFQIHADNSRRIYSPF